MVSHPGHGPGAQRHCGRPRPSPSAAGPCTEPPGAHRGSHPLPRALPGKPTFLLGCALLTFIPICKLKKKKKTPVLGPVIGVLMCGLASGLAPVRRGPSASPGREVGEPTPGQPTTHRVFLSPAKHSLLGNWLLSAHQNFLLGWDQVLPECMHSFL